MWAKRVGIDPGITGAIAFVSEKKILLFDMPSMVCPWIKPKKNKAGELVFTKMVAVRELKTLLLSNAATDAIVTMEIVHSMPKQGVVGAFNFGGSFHNAVAVVRLGGYMLKMITPQQWKENIGATCQGKDHPRQLALKAYPELYESLKLKKDQGKADALFIAIS